MKKYNKHIFIRILFLFLAILVSRIWTIHPLIEIIGDGGYDIMYNRKKPFPYFLNLLWKDDSFEVYKVN